MSNSLAIAAVTRTLFNLIFPAVNTDVPGTQVTVNPPDKARSNNLGNQINLFLYQTTLDGAWRNMDMPGQVKPGETAQPPLPLNLYYLITAYAENDDDRISHRLLGRAMSVLHDHPLLGADEIRAALDGNDLYNQLERVRITAQPLSLEEMSKLWTAFQTQYRISAAYQASVVLIDSNLPTRAPVPALTRGSGDLGPTAQADTTPPFPTLERLELPNQQLSAQAGDVLTLTGHHLDGASGTRFAHRRLPDPIPGPAPNPPATATEMQVQLPDGLPAGFCTVAAVITRAGQPDYTTNELPFPLSARITSDLSTPFARDAQGDVSLTLTFTPQVLPEQRVSLLLGEREILAPEHAAPTDTLVFQVRAADPGDYLLRLRVDGVDSLLVDRSVSPPRFDPSQKVTIT